MISLLLLASPDAVSQPICVFSSHGLSSYTSLQNRLSLTCLRKQKKLGLGFKLNGNNSCKQKKGDRRRLLRCNAEMSDLAPVTSVVYGTLLLGGGLFAYGRSGSKGSLIGGCSGAVLMAAAYYLMQAPETRTIGDALGFGAAFLFSAVFGIRLAATRKPVPAGPLLGLSIYALFVFGSAYFQSNI